MIEFYPDLFVAATNRFRDAVGDLRTIFNRINEALRSRRNREREIVWRPARVPNIRVESNDPDDQREVPAAAQRLIRWARQHPNQIFRAGFEPRNDGGEFNLAAYVGGAVDSLFVSTTRCFMEDGCLMRWRPDTTHRARDAQYRSERRYEYEIYAHGGIDVNRSLGENHQFHEQNEIAFPGGIRRELIRSVLEYDENGAPIRYWINEHFDLNVLPPENRVPISDLPNHLFPDYVEVVFWNEANQQPPGDHDRELRSADVDELMRWPGSVEQVTATMLTSKSLTQDDVPVERHQYAINIFGTEMVLTCVNRTELTLDIWQDKPTQHFRCTNYKGYIGFLCVGAADGNSRYLGFDNWEKLACKAHLQRDYEHIHPRADPAGGFYLFMHKDDKLAPVLRTSRTELKMMATSTTKFGFTALDTPRNSRVHWGLPAPSSESQRPINGGIYVIQVQGTTNRVFSGTGSNKNILMLENYNGSAAQHFRCTLYDNWIGFICVGAYGGEGRYINRDGWDVICESRYQRENEHIDVRPEPTGGFTLWMKQNDRGNRYLAAIARDGWGRLELTGQLTRVIFKPVSDIQNM
ncbi:hypothetical protein G7Y89_g10512 [Cudoniella acicularis]|uniref:Pierisin-like domain-containing protein n=1 Tax=Cudoniella acicularis TaxID=354080 RepID=A0A8H4RFC2_9HELO|nr:hypothetical protein G7Y89_g10512 [Cudoniella acicularis]